MSERERRVGGGGAEGLIPPWTHRQEAQTTLTRIVYCSAALMSALRHACTTDTERLGGTNQGFARLMSSLQVPKFETNIELVLQLTQSQPCVSAEAQEAIPTSTSCVTATFIFESPHPTSTGFSVGVFLHNSPESGGKNLQSGRTK